MCGVHALMKSTRGGSASHIAIAAAKQSVPTVQAPTSAAAARNDIVKFRFNFRENLNFRRLPLDRLFFWATCGVSGGTYLRFRARFPSRTLPSLFFPVPAPTRLCPFALPTSTLCSARMHTHTQHTLSSFRLCIRVDDSFRRAPARLFTLPQLHSTRFAHTPSRPHASRASRYPSSPVTPCSGLRRTSHRVTAAPLAEPVCRATRR